MENNLCESGHNTTTKFPKGWLLWHCYTSYGTKDSSLHLRFPNGEITKISGNFTNAMNGSFGVSPDRFTFMAIDKKVDEWDIFLYDSGKITNLTENSGFRNEDPKFSPDGKQIVFKRGKWDNNINDFVYNLALLDLKTNEITMLTNDSTEEAMPCFSADGKSVYYTDYKDSTGSICRMNLLTHEVQTIYSENGVTAYYPISKYNKLYFTKWYSTENHFDCIMCHDGYKISEMPFNTENYDCSDACPISDTAIIYSSTANGNYRLYYYDGKYSVQLFGYNNEKNELGADFYMQR